MGNGTVVNTGRKQIDDRYSNEPDVTEEYNHVHQNHYTKSHLIY